MALVKRNGHKYYYKMMRENGKFKRWYGGKGRLAEFLQSLQDQQRQEREEKRSIQAEQEQEHRQARNSGAAVFELVDIGLRASGFARYSRNPWRRRRVMKSLPSPNATKESPDAVRARIRKLADDAYYGSKKAVRQLRELAQAEPVKFASEVGISLSLLGREMLARRTFPNDPKLRNGLCCSKWTCLLTSWPATTRRLSVVCWPRMPRSSRDCCRSCPFPRRTKGRTK